jgi:hypothetical protein
MDNLYTIRMDKTALTIGHLNDASDEKAYWLGQPPSKRLEALELLRQICYDYDPTTARLQRVLEVAQRA